MGSRKGLLSLAKLYKILSRFVFAIQENLQKELQIEKAMFDRASQVPKCIRIAAIKLYSISKTIFR